MNSLKDKIIISTRPLSKDDSLKNYLSSKGAIVLDFPMIEIKPAELTSELKTTFQQIKTFDWIIFTSKNGVKYFFELLNQSEINSNVISSIKTAVIGIHTAEELEKFNTKPTFISKGNTSEDFLKELSIGLIKSQNKVLLALGNLARDILEKGLSSIAAVKRINVYNTNEINTVSLDIIEQIKLEIYDLIVFTSPSGFNHFIDLFKNDNCLKNLKIAGIGKTTEKAIVSKGYNPMVISAESNGLGLAKKIENYFKISNL